MNKKAAVVHGSLEGELGVEMTEDKMVVSEEDVVEEINPDDPLAAIYAKRDLQLKAQAGEATPPPQEEAKTDTAAPQVDTDVVVIVNGKEKLVAQSRIDAAGGIAAYQKSAAASELLNQASADARRLKERESQLQERERVLSLREQEMTQASRAVEPSIQDALDAIEEMAIEYHEALLDGDTKKASKLLLKMQAASTTTAYSKSEIADEAVRAAKAEMERANRDAANQRFEESRQDAVLEFQERFPDVADDPKLRAMADSETVTIQQAHPTWSPKEIITEAALSVRKWITERTAIPSAERKLEAKRSRDNIRGGSAASVTRQSPPPQSNSNYVEQLRKQRGLE